MLYDFTVRYTSTNIMYEAPKGEATDLHSNCHSLTTQVCLCVCVCVCVCVLYVYIYINIYIYRPSIQRTGTLVWLRNETKAQVFKKYTLSGLCLVNSLDRSHFQNVCQKKTDPVACRGLQQ